MPNLPRLSLAAVICPSTPFLAPRLLRIPVSLAVRSSTCSSQPFRLQRPSYATKANGKARARKADPQGQAGKFNMKVLRADINAPLLQQFRAACDARSVKTIMDLYPNLLALGALDRNDTRRMAQALHTYVRNRRGDTRARDAFAFVEHLVMDIQTGSLPPHPYAHVHLLGIYKECGEYEAGYAFWQWLVQKDETFVSSAVYGAAIELLAYGRKLSLPDLERLYVDAMKRFPGTFAEYHLSPDAIVPDRSQPIAILDLPVVLLQGILTARMLFRDWKNAYLALDTALRLFPAQVPPRFFELFMTQRSLPEAYTVYLVACRAGVVFKPNHLTVIIHQLREAMASSTSLHDRMMTLRAIANAIYAYLEAGGALENLHVGAFLRAFDSLLPEKAAGVDYEGEEGSLRNTIIITAHDLVTTLVQAGMPPSPNIFIALIHLAGKLRVPDLLKVSLQDVKTARIDLGAIGHRTVLTSAGYLQDKAIIAEHWTYIASKAESEGQQIDYESWVTFAKACQRADYANYFAKQLEKFEHSISTPLKLRVTHLIETEESPPPEGSVEMMEPKAFSAAIEVLKSQIKNIAAVTMAGQPLDLRKSPFHMFIDPDRVPLGSASDLRTVYNELSIDPHQPPPPEGSAQPAAVSSTGIPLDDLRFENWVSIVELMNEAELYEKTRRQDISHNKEQRKLARSLPAVTPVRLRRPESESVNLPMPLAGLRERIKVLRSPLTRNNDNSQGSPAPYRPVDRAAYTEATRLSRRPIEKARRKFPENT